MERVTKNWVLLIVLSCIWGSSFILMKKGMYTDAGELIFTDTQVASLRMLFASLVLLPVAVVGLKRIKSIKDFILLTVVGVFGNFIPAFLFTYAETGVSSGYAGMLNSFTPIFAILIGFTVFKNRLTKLQVLGVIVGTIGIILLAFAGQSMYINGSWMHVTAVILATFCYAISLNTIKYTLQQYNSLDITALAFFITLLPSIVFNFYSRSLDTVLANDHSIQGLTFIAILSVIGTAFAVLLFNRLISNSSVLFASSVTYLIPIVAVLIGLGFNEPINAKQVGAMAIVLIGVFIVNFAGIFKPKMIK